MMTDLACKHPVGIVPAHIGQATEHSFPLHRHRPHQTASDHSHFQLSLMALSLSQQRGLVRERKA